MQSVVDVCLGSLSSLWQFGRPNFQLDATAQPVSVYSTCMASLQQCHSAVHADACVTCVHATTGYAVQDWTAVELVSQYVRL